MPEAFVVHAFLNDQLLESPPHLLPLVEIIPCQVLAHDLAERAGITPGTVRYIQKAIPGEVRIPGEK